MGRANVCREIGGEGTRAKVNNEGIDGRLYWAGHDFGSGKMCLLVQQKGQSTSGSRWQNGRSQDDERPTRGKRSSVRIIVQNPDKPKVAVRKWVSHRPPKQRWRISTI